MTVSPEVMRDFLTGTDETGRFIVHSQRTGKTYAVEPIGTHPERKWGSVMPGQKALMHKKGDGKYTGAVDERDSMITPENGFSNIQTLEKGTSPLHAIKVIDDKYPTLNEVPF